MEMIQRWVDFLQDFHAGSTPMVIAAVVAAVILGSFLVYDTFHTLGKEDWPPKANPKRRGKVLRKQRRIYVDSLVTDEFTDRVEQLVYDGVITRAESNQVYVRLKKLFPVRNIFPSPELLKEAIRHRMASGLNAPVELPDKKPKPRHMFDKTG